MQVFHDFSSCPWWCNRLLKNLVRDHFKDNMDTLLEHLTGEGKGGKVIIDSVIHSSELIVWFGGGWGVSPTAQRPLLISSSKELT